MTVCEVFGLSSGDWLPISRQKWESKMKCFAEPITRIQMVDDSGFYQSLFQGIYPLLMYNLE